MRKPYNKRSAELVLSSKKATQADQCSLDVLDSYHTYWNHFATVGK